MRREFFAKGRKIGEAVRVLHRVVEAQNARRAKGPNAGMGLHTDVFRGDGLEDSFWVLRTWLYSWPGIGQVAAFDLPLTQYDDRGWRATFYTTGMEHSPTSATGTAWEQTPWRATQRAAWEVLKKKTD